MLLLLKKLNTSIPCTFSVHKCTPLWNFTPKWIIILLNLSLKEVLKLTPSEEDISKLIIPTKDNKPTNDLMTFQSFMTNKSQSIIPNIIVLVTNVSRIIETKMGKYQIATLMDTESQTLSINLYDSNIEKLEFGNIYKITKVKKALIRKNETTETRLMTTKFTKISQTNEDNKADFENVKLAENLIKGTILGYSEINSYKSCEKHWNKLDENDECLKCEGSAPKVKFDFNTDLYIQDAETDDIKSFLIFKRQATMIILEEDQDNHESIAMKMDELEGKECIVEFDEPANEEHPIVPKRLKLCIEEIRKKQKRKRS